MRFASIDKWSVSSVCIAALILVAVAAILFFDKLRMDAPKKARQPGPIVNETGSYIPGDRSSSEVALDNERLVRDAESPSETREPVERVSDSTEVRVVEREVDLLTAIQTASKVDRGAYLEEAIFGLLHGAFDISQFLAYLSEVIDTAQVVKGGDQFKGSATSRGAMIVYGQSTLVRGRAYATLFKEGGEVQDIRIDLSIPEERLGLGPDDIPFVVSRFARRQVSRTEWRMECLDSSIHIDIPGWNGGHWPGGMEVKIQSEGEVGFFEYRTFASRGSWSRLPWQEVQMSSQDIQLMEMLMKKVGALLFPS